MTTSLDTKELGHALATVIPALARNPTNPALNCARITARDGLARLTVTDLDLTITTPLDAGGDPLDVVVGAKRIAALVGQVHGETVELATTDDGLSVVSGSATATLNVVPVAEFPKVETDLELDVVKLSDHDVELLRRTVPFCSTDEQRPLLTGALFGGDMVTATTSFHLARATLSVELPEVLVPARTLRSVLAGTGELSVGADHARAVFRRGDTEWATRTIQGDPPSTDGIISMYSEPTTTVTCSVGELQRAVSLADLVRADGDPLRLVAEGDEVTISCRQMDVGEATDVADATVDGPPVTRFGFNPKFMRDVLANVSGDTVELGFFDGEGLKPMLVAEGDWLSLLMPQRISGG